MSITINYNSKTDNRNYSNYILFVEENFSKIQILKKYITNAEYSFVTKAIKLSDTKKEILSFDVSSKKKNDFNISK